MEEFTLPSGFSTKMKSLLSEEWEEFEEGYRTHQYQSLRFNPLKKGLAQCSYESILSTLSISKSEPVPWAKHGYYYNAEARPGKHPYHEAGLYYIQEPSAMSAAALLAPAPGERVLDLCAAPGGKSTQLAGYLEQTGLLIANEIHPARCKILSQNIERMGIANAIVTNEDSDTLATHFLEFFHKILVDAPCSGEGMFRKNPDAVAEWSPEQVHICANRQLMILENAASMLMSGGILVYSTCTFSPEENEGVIGTFLELHPEFSIVQTENPYFDHGRPEWGNKNPDLTYTFRLWPHHLKGEGHFAAVLRKEGTHSSFHIKEARGWKDKKLLSLFQEFTSKTVTKEMEDYLLSGTMTLFGDQLYRLPDDAPDLSGLRVLRAGLHLGTFKKNRFEPSHALALFLGPKDVKQAVSFPCQSPDTAKYYNGESISAETDPGWCLICVDNFSAGWGKSSGNVIKNHYPKGLRKNFL